MSQHNYIFSPSILKSYSDYVNCDKTWEKYYGNGEGEPKVSLEDFEVLSFNSLIDKINKVESKPNEAAARGTAFNDIVDYLIHGKSLEGSKTTDINIIESLNLPDCEDTEQDENYAKFKYDMDNFIPHITCKCDGFDFEFPLALCNTFANMYWESSMSQYHVQADLKTSKGVVQLHGYLDETNPFSIHDIKTTTSYESFKYGKGYQHLVYPYCLRKNGSKVDTFVYDIVVFGIKTINKVKVVNPYVYEINQEIYRYDDERGERDLVDVCESFIGFLEENKSLITNEKIFGKIQ